MRYKIRTRGLNVLDEQKFKKVPELRDDWLDSGEDMLEGSSDGALLLSELSPRYTNITIKRIVNEHSYKIFEIASNKIFPPFKAGQKIALTINLDGNYYTKHFVLISSVKEASEGIYKIVINNNKNDFIEEYIFNNVKVGEKGIVSKPYGDFTYNPIRDLKNVLLIISDVGESVALAMAQAVLNGNDNYKLTIVHTHNLMLEKEFKKLDESDSRVTVVKLDNVSAESLNNYMVPGETSIFIDGNVELLQYLNDELLKLRIPKKFIRYESLEPKLDVKRVTMYNLGIYIKNEKYDVPCYSNKTILYALNEGGIYLPGEVINDRYIYSFVELVLGSVKVFDDQRTVSEKKYNFIDTSNSFPTSDIEIIIR